MDDHRQHVRLPVRRIPASDGLASSWQLRRQVFMGNRWIVVGLVITAGLLAAAPPVHAQRFLGRLFGVRPAPSDSRPVAPPLRVATDFSAGSGNAVVNQQERTIRLDPTAYEGKGWACWWYIKVTGLVEGEILTLDVGEAPWATPDRAVFSVDNQRWSQTEAGRRIGKRIVYKHRVTAPVTWFAWGPPYTVEQAESFVNACADEPDAEAFKLAQTRAGRPVWALKIGDTQAATEPTRLVWLQARQHAWESGGSWVGQGFIEWLLSEAPQARNLRQTASFVFVPVMDVDSVAIGAGGKQQAPQDHNRDWTAEPHWPAVDAAMKHLHEADQEGRLSVFLDLHNPGANSRHPFFYIPPRDLLSQQANENLDRFLRIVRSTMNGPLSFEGEVHESGPKYDSAWKAISKNWVAMNCRDNVLSVTLETAWNTPHSTAEGYRTVGRQLGEAVAEYLAE